MTNTREQLTKVFWQLIDSFPMRMRKIAIKTIIEVKYLLFKMKWMTISHNNTVNPTKIYWISPNRISKCLPTEIRENQFRSEQMRGKVVGGDWDITNCKFADYDCYEAFRKRTQEGVEWQDTEYYKRLIREAKSGDPLSAFKNETEINERFRYLDELYKRIKTEGYRLNRDNYQKNLSFSEINVNIGRNGEYIFQDGIHRLTIAKLLEIKYVPVMVFVRHKKWQEFRESVVYYAKHNRCAKGTLCQPIVHPDLADIPCECERDFFEVQAAISNHLGRRTGTMLDIGANLGFFCHKFEDLGYECYAIENDPATIEIMEKIRIAEGKNFKIINKSIFEADFVKNMNFDVVLALKIFHHFLKTETLYTKFLELLKTLKTNELFFEPHNPNEFQMKGAYVNFAENEFVDFLLQHTSLNNSEIIYQEKSGRKVFKLSR